MFSCRIRRCAALAVFAGHGFSFSIAAIGGAVMVLLLTIFAVARRPLLHSTDPFCPFDSFDARLTDTCSLEVVFDLFDTKHRNNASLDPIGLESTSGCFGSFLDTTFSRRAFEALPTDVVRCTPLLPSNSDTSQLSPMSPLSKCESCLPTCSFLTPVLDGPRRLRVKPAPRLCSLEHVLRRLSLRASSFSLHLQRSVFTFRSFVCGCISGQASTAAAVPRPHSSVMSLFATPTEPVSDFLFVLPFPLITAGRGATLPSLSSSLSSFKAARGTSFYSVVTSRLFVSADAAATPDSMPPRKFTVCAFASNSDQTAIALAAKHAIEFYGQPSGRGFQIGRFSPNVSFDFKFLGDGSLSRSNYALSFAVATASQCMANQASVPAASEPDPTPSSSSCDALTGPGYSYLAIAMSPVVGPETVWVDPSATSVSLSSKADHPTFSRVMPSDATGAALGMAVFSAFKWTDVNVLCLDESYGRSVSQGITEAVAAANGTVHVSQCLLNDATDAMMKDTLTNIRDTSPSKLVFMGMVTGAAFHRLIDVIVEHKFDEKLIFFFSDAACSGGQLSYGKLKSGLCLTYTSNTTLLAPFNSAYESRNISEDQALLANTGWKAPPGFNFTATTLLGALAHDAAVHAMTALAARTAGQTAVDAVRSTVTVGATGTIALDKNGDRPTADAVLFNTQGAVGQQRAVGFVRGGVVTFTDATGSPDIANDNPPDLLLLGVRGGSIPLVALPPVPQSPPAVDNTPLIAALATLAAVIIAVVASVASYSSITIVRRRVTLSRCPSDPTKPFCAFFLSIKNEALLRDTFSAESAETVFRTVEQMVVRHSSKHECHVARRLDAHFLVLAKTPAQALLCIGDTLRDVEQYSWDRHAPTNLPEPVHGVTPSAALSCRQSEQSHGVPSITPRSRQSSKYHVDHHHHHHHPSKAPSPRVATRASLMSRMSRNSEPHSETQTETSRSSHARALHSRATVPFRPQISVGCSFCIGSITELSESERRVGEMPWRWGGAPIDQAAMLADSAAGDQVLCTEAVHDAVLNLGASHSHFSDLHYDIKGEFFEHSRRDLPGSTAPVAVYQLDVDGVPVRDHTSHRGSVVDASGGGGVLAALEADAGGVNTRKVAIVALHCPAFSAGSSNAMVNQALLAVTAIAAPLKGKVAAVVESTVFVTVNASGPTVSQAPSRAAAIALECAPVLSGVTGAPVFAGIEFGACAVGTAPGTDKSLGLGAPGQVLTNTALLQNAVVLAKLAEHSPCSVVAGQSAHAELEVGYLMRSVDIVAYPSRSTTTTSVNGGSPAMKAPLLPPALALPFARRSKSPRPSSMTVGLAVTEGNSTCMVERFSRDHTPRPSRSPSHQFQESIRDGHDPDADLLDLHTVRSHSTTVAGSTRDHTPRDTPNCSTVIPVPVPAFITSTTGSPPPPASGSNNPLAPPTPPNGVHRPPACVLRLVHGVVGTTAAGAMDDEWMYQLTDATNGNPFKAANDAMLSLLDDDADGHMLLDNDPLHGNRNKTIHVDDNSKSNDKRDKGDRVRSSSPIEEFNGLQDAVVLNVVRAIDTHRGATFQERLRSYAIAQANSATARFPSERGHHL